MPLSLKQIVTGVRLLANGELQIVGTDVKDKVKIEIKSEGGADFVKINAKLGGSDGSFDAEDLESEFDQLAEDLVGVQEITARESLFGRLE